MCGVQIHNTPNKYTRQRPNDLMSLIVVFQLRSACRESYSRITRGSMLRSRDELNTMLQVLKSPKLTTTSQVFSSIKYICSGNTLGSHTGAPSNLGTPLTTRNSVSCFQVFGVYIFNEPHIKSWSHFIWNRAGVKKSLRSPPQHTHFECIHTKKYL